MVSLFATLIDRLIQLDGGKLAMKRMLLYMICLSIGSGILSYTWTHSGVGEHFLSKIVAKKDGSKSQLSIDTCNMLVSYQTKEIEYFRNLNRLPQIKNKSKLK